MKKRLEKFQDYLRNFIFASAIIFFSYTVYYFLVNKINPTYRDCGVIVSKSTDEVIIKHGTKTNLYLNIQFEKSGFRSIDVSPTTYFKNKVGENVCFDLRKEVGVWHMINSIIGFFIIIIFTIATIVFFIKWLFKLDFDNE